MTTETAMTTETDYKLSILEAVALEHMQAGVRAVLSGEAKSFRTTLVSPDKVIEFFEACGGEQDYEGPDSNGWQWDFWITKTHNDIKYTVSGSGYYGGVEICRAEEEE